MSLVCRTLATFAVVLSLVACGSDADDSSADADDSSADTAALDAVLVDFESDEPGCAGAVGVDGEVVWTGSAGAESLEPLSAIDDETVFDIGSTSKQFTATAVLLLVAQGAVALDDTLREYMPDLPTWADEITIDHLLHHQGGIPDYFGLLEAEMTERTTVEDALEVIKGVTELEFEPGSTYEYSNSGYFLLSQVVESVTGQTLGDFLEEEVFGPLELDAVMDATPSVSGHATSYSPDEDDESGFVVADSLWEQTGDGAVWTTPAELVRWAPELWDSQLSDGLAEARLADAVETGEGDTYGGGIRIAELDGVTTLSHSGAWSGFQTELVVLPEEKLAAAISCNRDDDDLDPTELANELIAAWRDAS